MLYRMMIEHTKSEVEKRYTVENGYEHDAKVLIGHWTVSWQWTLDS